LNSLDFGLKLFKFVVVFLILYLHFRDLGLDLVLLLGPYHFTVLVNQASHRILFPNLLNFVRFFFYFVPNFVNALTKRFTSGVPLLEFVPVLLHGFVFPIAFSKHFECFSSVC